MIGVTFLWVPVSYWAGWGRVNVFLLRVGRRGDLSSLTVGGGLTGDIELLDITGLTMATALALPVAVDDAFGVLRLLVSLCLASTASPAPAKQSSWSATT